MNFHEADKAIKRGDLIRLRAELEDGLDPDLSQNSCTLLMLAAMTGNTGIGRLLIEKGADLERRNSTNWTALSFAIHTAHPSFVKLMLSKGASLDCYPIREFFRKLSRLGEQILLQQ